MKHAHHMRSKHRRTSRIIPLPTAEEFDEAVSLLFSLPQEKYYQPIRSRTCDKRVLELLEKDQIHVYGDLSGLTYAHVRSLPGCDDSCIREIYALLYAVAGKVPPRQKVVKPAPKPLVKSNPLPMDGHPLIFRSEYGAISLEADLMGKPLPLCLLDSGTQKVLERAEISTFGDLYRVGLNEFLHAPGIGPAKATAFIRAIKPYEGKHAADILEKGRLRCTHIISVYREQLECLGPEDLVFLEEDVPAFNAVLEKTTAALKDTLEEMPYFTGRRKVLFWRRYFEEPKVSYYVTASPLNLTIEEAKDMTKRGLDIYVDAFVGAGVLADPGPYLEPFYDAVESLSVDRILAFLRYAKYQKSLEYALISRAFDRRMRSTFESLSKQAYALEHPGATGVSKDETAEEPPKPRTPAVAEYEEDDGYSDEECRVFLAAIDLCECPPKPRGVPTLDTICAYLWGAMESPLEKKYKERPCYGQLADQSRQVIVDAMERFVTMGLFEKKNARDGRPYFLPNWKAIDDNGLLLRFSRRKITPSFSFTS